MRGSEVRPPKSLQDLQGAEHRRVGFSDLVVDPDGIVRRSLLSLSPGEKCSTPFSFSLQLVFHYLAERGIEAPQYINLAICRFSLSTIAAECGQLSKY